MLSAYAHVHPFNEHRLFLPIPKIDPQLLPKSAGNMPVPLEFPRFSRVVDGLGAKDGAAVRLGLGAADLEAEIGTLLGLRVVARCQ